MKSKNFAKNNLNVYISHDIESTNPSHNELIGKVLKTVESNEYSDLHLTLNSSKALLNSKNYQEEFTKVFGREYN